jgi:hypothetical protein
VKSRAGAFMMRRNIQIDRRARRRRGAKVEVRSNDNSQPHGA